MTTAKAPDSATTPPPGTTSTSEPTPAHRRAEFLEEVERLLKGDKKPKGPAAGPIVEDLRAVAAEQDQVRKQIQQMSEDAQKAQASLLQAQGRADALLQVLHRLEATAAK